MAKKKTGSQKHGQKFNRERRAAAERELERWKTEVRRLKAITRKSPEDKAALKDALQKVNHGRLLPG